MEPTALGVVGEFAEGRVRDAATNERNAILELLADFSARETKSVQLALREAMKRIRTREKS